MLGPILEKSSCKVSGAGCEKDAKVMDGMFERDGALKPCSPLELGKAGCDIDCELFKGNAGRL